MANPVKSTVEIIGQNHPVANPENRGNENPGALAGATGANQNDDLAEANRKREVKASAVTRAVAACDPADRLPFVEAMLEALRPGKPVPAFSSIMDEAEEWASWASRAERKAYALACFRQLSTSDRTAFLNFVLQEEAA